MIRKIRKRGARVRSAYDQYTIHCISYDFVSDVLKIPKPHSYDEDSYVMDQFHDACYIPERQYSTFPSLVVALLSYTQYMISNGYWPYKYSIFRCGAQFFLIDMSRYGYIDSNRVKFPKDPTAYTMDEATAFYGMRMYDEFDFVPNTRMDVFQELLYM